MKLIYIRAHAQFAPGDVIDLDVEAPARDDDGAYVSPPPWSELYLAEPDRPEALRAIADRQAADAETEPGGDAEAAKAVVATALAADTEGK